jgi:comEA protein
MALLCISSISGLIWFWQRGLLTSFSPDYAKPSDQERSTLKDLQEKNNALEAEVQQLRTGQVSETTSATTSTNNSDASGIININTATQTELDTLPGIGASKAAAIIEYRQSHGLFKSPHEITNVKGIGESTYDQLKSHIIVSNP